MENGSVSFLTTEIYFFYIKQFSLIRITLNGIVERDNVAGLK